MEGDLNEDTLDDLNDDVTCVDVTDFDPDCNFNFPEIIMAANVTDYREVTDELTE